jgi:signal transduction histidine kinase
MAAVTHASMRFASAILRRLGEELNPNPDQGILELAKNAYDADARRCVIELKNVGEAGGTIRVVDNGVGMTAEEILSGWLVLGRSTKNVHQLTALGRVPAGNKGLGRLAALRLGRRVELVTRPRSKPDMQYRLELDWDEFDAAGIVEDVVVDVIGEERTKGRKQGSVIVITHLRKRLGRMDVKRLARALILLADPFGEDSTGFRPQLKTEEFSDLEKLVDARYFEDADYHLIANVDGEGQASARAVDWRGNVLFEADHGELTRRRKPQGARYDIPPTRFDLWIYLLTSASFATRSVTLGEVREWLDAFGGVHLYVNGLRVSPYGNTGNDWLEMNVQRAASPEERPSTNTSLGRMSISDRDGVLVQKTDRTGLIEDAGYEDLRSFARDAMDWLARRRVDVAQKRRAAERRESEKATGDTREGVVAAIEQAPEGVRAPILRSFGHYDRARQQEADRLRREVQLYRTLSTAGITAATFAHESSSNPLKIISQVTGVIERRSKKALDGRYDELLGPPVRSLKRATRSLSVLSSVTLALIDRDRRRPGRVELHGVIVRVLRTFRPFLEGRDVEVRRQFAHGDPYLRGTEAAVESIITNLLNNALAAFERAEVEQRQIEIRTEIIDSTWVLRVLDNGLGIQDIEVADIWLPGETTQLNGTGLGLAIVRDAVTDLGGSYEAVARSELGGAEIRIELPLLGS